ncbi:two-component system, NtrC family, sensor kinase [Methylomarinovum caldicuralii]|uniref:histidine kinase n=1 Tax=Methylomarinovum caldicuralii TaxID=438856 RepID=A0AAU9CAX3_9GAMM|nr:ATP-binding protein [Methylomarinovum caldicuralii]BCX81664.1 two-component system, NtrC family, sensor kinase [Methylomarinovum caldicuralii]
MPSVKQLLYRPLIAATVLASLAVAAVIAAFIFLSDRNLARIHRIEATVGQVNQLQAIDHQLQAMLLDGPDPRMLANIRTQLQRLEQEWPDLIPAIVSALDDPSPPRLGSAIRRLQSLLGRENQRETRLLAQIVADTEMERRAAFVGLIVLSGLLALGALLTWRWLLLPLRRMNLLLLQLADGRFEPIDNPDSSSPWRPVLDNYNRMVRRLAELERARRERTEQLESQVRRAASTLLAQNRDLARAERLAAVGEVAAGLAHELRNPLAGIRLALHNLRSDTDDPETWRRLDLVIAELERISRHLNQFLDQARHRPEPPRTFELAPVVQETLELLRYQLPPDIALQCHIPTGLQVQLPETGLRQVLINLVLNAAQALGTRGCIRIEARIEPGRLLLTVSDDGPGFPPSLLAHGVRPFASSRDGGTGLGLLMVKRFVSALDGRLELANRPEGGARVTLEIPCAPPC